MEPWQIAGIAGAAVVVLGGGFFALGAWQRSRGSREDEQDYLGEAFACPPIPLEQRLADCLAAAIDTPLLTLEDPEGFGRKVELRLSSFQPALAEHAARLLEEAGL